MSRNRGFNRNYKNFLLGNESFGRINLKPGGLRREMQIQEFSTYLLSSIGDRIPLMLFCNWTILGLLTMRVLEISFVIIMTSFLFI